MKNLLKFLVLTSCFIFCAIQSQAQLKELIIKITPDDFPADITWELETQDFKTIVASGDLSGCQPGEECILFQGMVEDRCYTFELTDIERDGLKSGGYEVIFDNEFVVQGQEFDDYIYHNFNCGLGEVCENAEVLTLPTPPFTNIWAPDWKEYWFELTPEIDGFYKISTCDNFLSGKGWADTTIWIYDNCDRRLQTQGTEGALAHNEDSHDCSPSSEFDFFPLEGGVTYYLRVKPIEPWENSNDSIFFKVQKRPVKRGCNDPAACNYDPFAQVFLDGSCKYSAECGPDLSFDEEYLRNSIEVDTVFNSDACFVDEGCLRGPGAREVIRFATKIDNIGDADYIVGLPQNDTLLFSRENCHGHYHHLGYAEYLIYEGEGQPQPVGFKSGFCVLDLDCTNSGGTLGKYYCGFMGITQGCSDIYEPYLDCQWIDVTDVPDGQYSIVVRVNHFRLADARKMQEKTYDNNTGTACVTIDRSSGALVVTVAEDCEDYVDCKGIKGGDTEIDCNGECGGTAHPGDLDGTGELEMTDYQIYLDLLSNKAPLEGPCQDMNADGNLSLYDALLVRECLDEKEREIDNPFHEHCTYPAGLDLSGEQTSIRVVEFNTAENYIDLEYWVPTRDLNAYQINTSGIQISQVETLYSESPTEFMYNNESVFAIHTDEYIERNTGYAPFIRIRYSEITGDSICVTGNSEFINKDYNRTNLVVEDGCLRLSSTSDVQDKTSTRVSIIPNPAIKNIAVYADGKFVEQAQILDVNGKLVMQENVATNNGFELNVSGLDSGVYLVQLYLRDGEIVSERFMKAQ